MGRGGNPLPGEIMRGSKPGIGALLRQPHITAYLAGFTLFTVIFLKNAWVAEDAYILFRSIEQLFAGHGPVWNPHDRVQVFTSPLWYLSLSFCRIFSRDLFLDAIILSLLLGIGTLHFLKLVLDDAARWLCVVVLLVSSRGFFDYTSSGIENPLGYFLLVMFLYYFRRLKDHAGEGAESSRDFSLLALCAGLLLTCRHDLVTLVLPPLLLACREQRSMPGGKMARVLFAGLSPFIAWSLFSLIYYGFPFPNTAYAKLHTGIPRSALWAQGGKYLLSSLQNDPVTLPVIAAAVVILLLKRNRYAVSIACGILLNLVYILNVGGDFMQGRFLSFAYLVSLTAVFSSVRIPAKAAAGIVAACCVYWVGYADNPVATPTGYAKSFKQAVDRYGVADERGFYFSTSSFWKYLGRDTTRPFPLNHLSVDGQDFAASPYSVTTYEFVGFFGYWAGTGKIVVDPYALADPFLARLPALVPWRIGHFERKVPDGYLESIATGQNLLQDPQLRQLYDEIRLITQGPLWRKERMRAIVRANLGCG